MAGKKKGKPSRKPITGGARPAPSLPRAVLEQVEQAQLMLDRKQAQNAEYLLRDLDKRYPSNTVLLQMLCQATYATRNLEGLLDAADRLNALSPNDPDFMAQRAFAHAAMAFAFLAQRYFQQLIDRFPTHPKSENARKTIADLQPAIARTTEQMTQAGYPVADIPELSARHEQVQVWLAREKYAEARRVAAGILSRWPTFAPAWNNTGEAWYREGNAAQAVEATRQSLTAMPGNCFAASNLARFLFLDGKFAEASELASKLVELPIQHPDNRVKKVETLGLMVDDHGVLRVWEQGEQEGYQLQDHHLAWFHHYAAVSAYYLGDEKRARELWARCLKANPNFGLANSCIQDLDRPVGAQNGPWVASLDVWLPQAAREEILSPVGNNGPATTMPKVRDELRRYLKKYPSIVPLVPHALNRSDEGSRTAMVRLCGLARTPELLEALRDFALSQRGSDNLRIQAAFTLAGAGLLPGGEARMWLEGQWKQQKYPTAEITGERTSTKLLPRLEALMAQASEATHKRDIARAETLTRQVLVEVPDNPSAQYNLAHLLKRSGREAEGRTILLGLRAAHPEYPFGIVEEARELLREGDLERAEELLAPMLDRSILHYTEFRAVALGRIELAEARRDREAARWWIPLLEAIDPNDANLPTIRQELGMR